jgi:hypothetical protein
VIIEHRAFVMRLTPGRSRICGNARDKLSVTGDQFDNARPHQLGAGAALAAGFADSGDEGRHYTGPGQAAFAIA